MSCPARGSRSPVTVALPALLALTVGACAAGAGAGAPGWGPEFTPSLGGPPDLVLTAMVVPDATRKPLAPVASDLFAARSWPVSRTDEARDVFVSDWQYYQTAVPTGPGPLSCQNALALRFLVRRLGPPGGREQLGAQLYLPRGAAQRDATEFGRAAFAAFARALVTAASGSAEAGAAATALEHGLRNGPYRPCVGFRS